MTIQRTTSPDAIPEPDASAGQPSWGVPAAVRYGAALAMTALATALAAGVDSTVAIPNLSLVYVIPVVVAAVAFGLGPSLCAAVLGALAYNYFLTAPRYSLAVDDPANIWSIGLLFLVGCVASAVASTSRHKAVEAAHLKRQAALLQAFGRDVIAADRERAVVAVTASALEALFNVPVVVMRVVEATAEVVETCGGIDPVEAETEAARYTATENRHVHAAVYPYDTSRFDFWPVPAVAGSRFVIGLAFDPADRPAEPGTPVGIVVSLLALALTRQQTAAGPRPGR
ncbi:DUF4118 domain-containing protein [Chelatococcus reniformis]|uniref:Sensor protein KdpD transmembrane domain-containing protein n=1 Tax=Chelatococcus reniformis TaxID=1494448 RepID=A0A916UKI2_9HYPH|nr:DUF4118 domain-containing protein [Chelatococcus reniformis]GGC75637.1 hypothetical protein GCM10010994_37620 [Chelatococcus reniformis]